MPSDCCEGMWVDLFIAADAVVFNATGLLFIVLGVLTLIRMTGFPDLTVDGSFTIGAVLYSSCLVAGWGTAVALLIAVAGGASGGLLTWTINTRLGVGKVVSGVLTMIILILSAPYISGGSTKGLLNVKSFYSWIDSLDALLTKEIIGDQSYQAHVVFSMSWLVCFSLVVTVVIAALRTRLGLRLRYIAGAVSPTLVPVREQQRLLLSGLMIGNMLVALGGAVEAQRRGGYTNNMGTGVLLVALAVLVLGEALMKSIKKREFLRLPEQALAILVGVFLYSSGIQALLALRIAVVDLRLLTAFFLLILLGIAGRVHSSSTRLF